MAGRKPAGEGGTATRRTTKPPEETEKGEAAQSGRIEELVTGLDFGNLGFDKGSETIVDRSTVTGEGGGGMDFGGFGDDDDEGDSSQIAQQVAVLSEKIDVLKADLDKSLNNIAALLTAQGNDIAKLGKAIQVLATAGPQAAPASSKPNGPPPPVAPKYPAILDDAETAKGLLSKIKAGNDALEFSTKVAGFLKGNGHEATPEQVLIFLNVHKRVKDGKLV